MSGLPKNFVIKPRITYKWKGQAPPTTFTPKSRVWNYKHLITFSVYGKICPHQSTMSNQHCYAAPAYLSKTKRISCKFRVQGRLRSLIFLVAFCLLWQFSQKYRLSPSNFSSCSEIRHIGLKKKKVEGRFFLSDQISYGKHNIIFINSPLKAVEGRPTTSNE